MSFLTWVWVRRVAALLAGFAEYYGLFPAFGLEGPAWARGIAAAIAVWIVLTVAGRVFWLLSDMIAHRAGRFDPAARARREWQGEGGPFSRWLRRSEAADYGRGASSGWETRLPSYGPGKVFLGRAPWSLRPVGMRTEKHMVTFGATGSGKSAAVMVPNLCLYPADGSVLCIDPKGELARISSARRGQGGNGVKGLGQDVHVLDPFGVTDIPSSRYNLFDELAAVAARDVDRPVSYAGKIAEALVKAVPNDPNPYWDNAARTLIRGLVLYVMGQEARNLGALRRLLAEGDAEGWKKLDGESQERKDPFDVLFDKMGRAEGPYGETIRAGGISMVAMSPNQRSGVLTTAQEHMAFLDAPEMKRVTAASDFLLDDLRRKALSVYVCLPINMVAAKEGRWLRMFVVLFIDMMLRGSTRPKTPVLLAIDEFPSLGFLEGMSMTFPILRSFGCRVHIAGQSLAKVKAVYPDDWQEMIGGAEAVQVLGVKDPETVDFLARRLGRHTVEQSQAIGGQEQAVMAERAVMEPDEVARFLAPDLENQIVWRGNRRAMKLKVAPYYKYLPRWYWTPDPRR